MVENLRNKKNINATKAAVLPVRKSDIEKITKYKKLNFISLLFSENPKENNFSNLVKTKATPKLMDSPQIMGSVANPLLLKTRSSWSLEVHVPLILSLENGKKSDITIPKKFLMKASNIQ